MKFCSCQIIFLAISVLVFLSNDVEGILDAVGELITTAINLGAPFAKTSTKRMYTNIFGNERGPRSTDIILFNKSNKSFTLASTYCEHGGYSNGLFPEQEIESKKSSLYRVRANGFMTGVSCLTKYTSTDGSWFSVKTHNPYMGSNSMVEDCSESLLLTPTLGNGNNNEVRWIIEDAK